MSSTKQDQRPPSETGKADSHKKQLPGTDQQDRNREESGTWGEDPEKKISIDDDPEQTKRKIPHMKTGL